MHLANGSEFVPGSNLLQVGEATALEARIGCMPGLSIGQSKFKWIDGRKVVRSHLILPYLGRNPPLRVKLLHPAQNPSLDLTVIHEWNVNLCKIPTENKFFFSLKTLKNSLAKTL